jgi:sigma-B regulation protein RsbU (phosphoserine phosphatase)
MLRADAVSLVLGVLLVVAGLITLVFWARVRRRAASLAWLGIFAFLYGLRQLAVTDSFRLYFDVAPAAWEYVAAALTYALPLPILLFIRVFVPTWRRFLTVAAAGVTVFAIYAIASDAILRRPDSARTPNNVIAIILLGALVGIFFRRGLTPSRELRTARVGVLTVALTALADNLRGMNLLAFPGPALEPFGFTVLIVCFGTLAARRILGDARRLVAIDRELSIARQIQSSILPQAMPRLSGVSLAARYRPMTAVAGDFYDFLEIDEQRLGALVADVSGHGVPAALIASMVKVALASQQARADRPAAVLAGLNEALCGRLGGQYVTAAYLFIDGRSGLIRYAAAGHPPMLRVSRRSLEVRDVEKNGFALGFVEGAEYEELELPLDAGDRLVLYTDGLTEAANGAEDLFGADRVKTALAAGAARSPDAAADALLNTMDAWSGQPATDDLTIVLVDWERAT